MTKARIEVRRIRVQGQQVLGLDLKDDAYLTGLLQQVKGCRRSDSFNFLKYRPHIHPENNLVIKNLETIQSPLDNIDL